MVLEKNKTAEANLATASTRLVELNTQIKTAKESEKTSTDETAKGKLKQLIEDRTKLVKEISKLENNSRAWLFHSTTSSNKWGILGFGGKSKKSHGKSKSKTQKRK